MLDKLALYRVPEKQESNGGSDAIGAAAAVSNNGGGKRMSRKCTVGLSERCGTVGGRCLQRAWMALSATASFFGGCLAAVPQQRCCWHSLRPGPYQAQIFDQIVQEGLKGSLLGGAQSTTFHLDSLA